MDPAPAELLSPEPEETATVVGGATAAAGSACASSASGKEPGGNARGSAGGATEVRRLDEAGKLDGELHALLSTLTTDTSMQMAANLWVSYADARGPKCPACVRLHGIISQLLDAKHFTQARQTGCYDS